jgi:hypothetical protein
MMNRSIIDANIACFKEGIRTGKINEIKYWFDKAICKNDNDEYYLFYAVIFGHLDAVKCLVDLGWNPRCSTDGLLESAVIFGHFDIIQYLISVGCDPKIRHDQVIYAAGNWKHLKIAKYLISLDCYLSEENYRLLDLLDGEIHECLLVDGLTKKNQMKYLQSTQKKKILPLQHRKFILNKVFKKNTFLKFILRPRSMAMQLNFI